MRMLERALAAGGHGENARAIRIFARVVALQDLAGGGAWRRVIARLRREPVWPVTGGAYAVGDPMAPVAICTLTSMELMEPLVRVPGVAIVGRLYTVNLGIEKIILNVTANPAIRFLVLCGKESPVFHPAQGLRALCRDGVDAGGRIVGATGHLPLLRGVPRGRIDRFRRQVELIDCTGETDLAVLQEQVRALAARAPAPGAAGPDARSARTPAHLPTRDDAYDEAPRFAPLRTGGPRQPLVYDPKGFFIITLDRDGGEIILRHYLSDATPAHEMRGRAAEPMVLGLIREDLITQLSHAGYLGAELAKAEAALRLGARYEQDKPLRPGPDHGAPGGAS
jgi:tetrahydromethanopterin S-methyltransferase subunit A